MPHPFVHNRRQKLQLFPSLWLLGAILAVALSAGSASGPPRDPFLLSSRFISKDDLANSESRFQVPIAPSAIVNTTIYLKVPGSWNYSQIGAEGLCIAIVEHPEECVAAKLQRLIPCAAQALWSLSAPGSFLGFQLPRPAFTTSPSATANHSVCLWAHDTLGRLNRTLGNIFLRAPKTNPALLGSVNYFPMPTLHFGPRIERIGVRTFLNPGWRKDVKLQCLNCSASTQIAIRLLEPSTNCKGIAGPVAAAMLALRGQRGPAAAAALLHGLKLPGVICEAPQHGPCHGYIDSSFTIGQWTGSTEEYAPASKADLSHTQVATFQIQSHQRLAALERRHLFHHRSAICLYPHDGYPQGWLAGYAEFHMDGPDVQAFVGFVCFFGIALPLICMVTVLLHVNKQQRCKQHVQALRMQLQREQLERELHDREEVASAWAGVGTSTSTSTSSTTRSSPWRPHRLPPPRVQRPTMDDGHLPIL